MLGWGVSFKAYAENVREKTTKCFDIYQVALDPNCFKSHKNS